MTDPRADFAIDRFRKMQSVRGPFEADWQDIRYYVRPITSYVTYGPQLQFYTVRPETMFDGTAPEALEELSCALHSYLSNPAERWFEVQLEGENVFDQDPEVVDWLQHVSDIIYSSYQRDGSMINLALHECYMDLGSFGTCVLNQEWDSEAGNIVFAARPLGACYFTEDHQAKIDSVCRHYVWTLRQVEQEFPEMTPKLREMQGKDPLKNMDRLIDVINLVCPRSDRVPGKPGAKNMRYKSLWVTITTNEVLGESGYETFPYHVARWTKLAGEVYGRGPAKKCLPDIKMLNQMEKTVLKAGQKQVDPPLILRHDAFMLPIKTSPGGMIYKEDEEAQITPLETKGNLPWGEEKSEQKRKFIEKCFYADWIRMEKENVEMTAYEVQDRRDEKLRLLAPIFGRITSELHGPMIARSYQLLDSHGKIPQAPGQIRNASLKIGYLSPAAQAQLGAKAVVISRFLTDAIPMIQADPGVGDGIDFVHAMQVLALARGVPRPILRSPEQIAQVQAERKKQQAMQQLAQAAPALSQSVKNVADAQAKSPDTIRQLGQLVPSQ